jgi:hypothetical protein
MGDKRPTDAEIRLWIARVKAEHNKGTPLQETNLVLAQMIASWEAVEDGAALVPAAK